MPKLLSSGKTWTAFLIWMLSGVGLGLVTILLFAAGRADRGVVIAIAVAVTAAAMLTGGVTGFIFGVPKMFGTGAIAVEQTGPDTSEAESPGHLRIIGNTNLEQVSDWLTKILVGVGLTQFGAISSFGRDVVDSVAPALGGGVAAKVFAGALLMYSVGFGFVTGWLYTRLLLGGAMAAADRRATARTLITAAQSAQQAGDAEAAHHLREQAMDLLDQEADSAATGETRAEDAGVDGPRETQLTDRR